jgi:hypothetical protein
VREGSNPIPCTLSVGEGMSIRIATLSENCIPFSARCHSEKPERDNDSRNGNVSFPLTQYYMNVQHPWKTFRL